MTDKREEVTTIKCKPHESTKNSLKAEFSGTMQGRNLRAELQTSLPRKVPSGKERKETAVFASYQ